eukprot:COSAG02_NODE_62859_length_264_cov_1.909091_1_plen_20_part_10
MNASVGAAPRLRRPEIMHIE